MAPKDKSSPAKDPAAPPEGERIAKVLSRRGIASRREAERLIAAGEVTVNGKRIDSPALNVTAKDRITVAGKPLPDEEPARLWLYYKPEGLVTSASDEKGRDTVFDHLPEDMPRVMSVGRLDLNSEGLLLLTNDGELKRRLELPSTGWLRKYRVRVNGNPVDPDLDPLRKGIVVEGERFQPMQVTLDRVQGANAWLTVGLREGKNREIRRAMNAIGLYVNRLIRTSYGPFRLGDLQPGEVEEVRAKVLRDQLGLSPEDHDTTGTAKPKRTSHKVPVRPSASPGAKPSPRSAGKPAVETTPAPRKPLPKPQKPGDGVRILSSAWKEAVRPRLPGAEDAAPARKTTARPAAPSAAKPPAANAAKPSAKPHAKGAAKTAEKPGAKAADPGKPASRKPATRTAPTRNTPTRNAPTGGPRRK
jgi:23S rRNA pseudouridine2605 synthase